MAIKSNKHKINFKSLFIFALSTIYWALFFLRRFGMFVSLDEGLTEWIISGVFFPLVILIQNTKDDNKPYIKTAVYLMVGVNLLSCAVKLYTKDAYADPQDMLKTGFMSIACISLCALTAKSLKIISTSIIFASIPFLFYFILKKLTGSSFLGNWWGLIFIYTGLVLIYRISPSAKIWLLILVHAALLGLLYVCESRTAFMGGVLAISISLFYRYVSYKKVISKFAFIIFAVAMITVFAALLLDEIMNMLFNKWKGYDSLATVNSRQLMWTAATALKRFWGLNYSWTLNIFGVRNVHSTFIQPFVNFGYPGLIVNVFYLAACAIMIIRSGVERLRKAIVFIPALFMAYFESNYLFDPTHFFFGVVLLLMCAEFSTQCLPIPAVTSSCNILRVEDRYI
jgi:hypothetical protein